MERKHRIGFSWLAVVLCMALLMTGMPFAPAYAKSKKDKYYTIKWKVNGETVKKDKVKKGEKPEAPEDPADYSDGEATYTFVGWEPKVTKAKEDTTYKAKFKKKKAAKTVTITWLDDEGVLIDFTQVKVGKTPKHEDPKKKATKKYSYVFDGWEPELTKASEDTTYTATFKKKARKYKITWLDDKGNVIDETKVAYGELPEHDDPVKKSKKATYTFTGWEPAITEVTGEATYTATFRKEAAEAEAEAADVYTITWLDDAGNVIDTTTVKAGKKPTHDDPAKEPTEQYTYAFAGWEPKVTKAKADATYTATFEQKTRKYKITWLDDEGNVIDETKVPYGEVPVHEAPAMSDSESHSYVFRGWDPEPVAVTGKAAYTAVFDEIPKEAPAEEPPAEETPAEETPAEETPVEATPVEEAQGAFTVTWLDDMGNPIDTTTVQPGEVPFHEAPEKAPSEQYSYTFAGWWPEPVAATGDATYSASYTPEMRTYYVTWTDDLGNPIDTTLVGYGDMPVHDDPVKPDADGVSYTFAGWSPELAPVTGDTTYTAIFIESLPAELDEAALAGEVTITFAYGYDGAPEAKTIKVVGGEPFDQGQVPKYTRDNCALDGWNPVIPETYPTSDTTYTAQWVQGIAVTFAYGYDAGSAQPTIIYVKSGAEVTAADAPAYTREGFVLDGWDVTFPVTITEAKTITAKWKKTATVGPVDCHAYRPPLADAKGLLPKKSGDIDLDWTNGTVTVTPEYKDPDKQFTDETGDGEYTFTLIQPERDGSYTYNLEVTCVLKVGGDVTSQKPDANFKYRLDSVKDDAKVVITAWTGPDADEQGAGLPLTITTVDDKTVVGIAKNVFKDKKLSEIVVPAGVKTIGDSAFANMTQLQKLTLPDSLTSIAENAFTGTAPATQTLTVGKATTMATGYTISHPIETGDEPDPADPTMSKPVTLPAGMPTDLAITAGTDVALTMKADLTIKWDHSATGVTAETYKSNGGKLKAEIRWLNEDDTVFDTTEEEYTTTPKHDEHPPKASTAQYDYPFKAWDPTPVAVTNPTFYKATFDAKLRPYTITFVQDDGKTEIEKKSFDYGTVPECSKEATKEGNTFVGWLDANDNEYKKGANLPKVTGDATYKAKYEVNSYTITFVDDDGKTNIEDPKQWKYNDVPTCGKTPSKDGYTFIGWLDANNKLTKKDADLPKVTADATYKASYEEEVKTNVALKVTYTGSPLTKVYDLTRNAFKKTSSGGYTYLVTTPKAADFTLAAANKDDEAYFNKHKDVKVKVTSIKKVEQFKSADVGSYTLKFTFGLEGNDAKYYTAQAVDVPATITAREVVVTPRAGLSKVYGTKDPTYPSNSWLSTDTSSPLHQDISGQPGYAVPVNVNSQTGKLSLSVTQQAYLLAEAKQNKTKFFPNGWLTRESGEDAKKYKITIGDLGFGKNFSVTLKDEVFTITAKPLSDANITVDGIPNQSYTGKAIELDEKALVVRYGTMTLKKDTDFTVKYENNTEVGTAKVTLTGKGNYTGTRTVTFSIIKTSSGDDDDSGDSGGSGSSGSGYGYDGFDDEEEGEPAAAEEEPEGILKLNGVEIGTILYGADGKPRPFTQFEEEIEVEEDPDAVVDIPEDTVDDAAANETEIEIEDMPEAPTAPIRLTIVPKGMVNLVPDPAAQPVEDEDGEPAEPQMIEEPVMIEGTQRQQFEELHLRLTTSEIQALVNNNVAEIVYELENSQLVFPLSALTDQIPVPGEEAEAEEEIVELDDEDEEFEIEEEIEIEEEGDDEEIFDDDEGMEEIDTPVDVEEELQTMAVEGYDIVIEQADATGLTQREQALIADNQLLMPAYRVRISVIPEGAEQVPTGEMDENEQPITIPTTEPLPEGYTLPETVLKLVPNDRFMTAPVEPQVLYASPELEEEDAEAEGVEGAAVPADPLAEGEATLESAMFDEEDDPIKVVVEPVLDGMYVTIAPPDWDPAPYLTEVDDEAEGDIPEADDEELEIEDEDEEIEIEDEGDEEFEEF